MKREYMLDDVIAAISTPIGTGGIGIVRMSGAGCIALADSIFIGKKKLTEKATHTLSYGKITDGTGGEIIDEVLVSVMKAPHTYTKEDIVEINCHGGSLVTRRVLEAVLKVGIFLTYMVAISKMKEIHRVFEYHGAEHKTIACYEAGDELTVENVRKYTRFHPRCGTSFLILVVIVSVFLYSVLPWGSIGLRVLFKLLLLPLVMGISYELLKWCGRSDNIATRIIRQPGIWVQHLTVFEPDDSMIEVAIAAVTPVLPEDPEDGKW